MIDGCNATSSHHRIESLRIDFSDIHDRALGKAVIAKDLLQGCLLKDEMPIAGANYLAGLLASEIIRFIDTGSCTLSNGALSIDLLDLCNTKHIAVSRHPMCGCGWR